MTPQETELLKIASGALMRARPKTPLMEWAQTIRIRLFGLPRTVEDLHRLARQQSKRRLIPAYIVACVRHQHTNYPNLLKNLEGRASEESPMIAHEILQDRVNAKIEATLDRLYGDAWRKCKE